MNFSNFLFTPIFFIIAFSTFRTISATETAESVELTLGMPEHAEKEISDKIRSKFLPEQIRQFVDACKLLSSGLSEMEKYFVIKAAIDVPVEKLTTDFIRRVNQLSADIKQKHKHYIVASAGKIYPTKFSDEFVAHIQSLCEQFSSIKNYGSKKSMVIEVLSQRAPENFSDFVRIICAIIKDLEANDKYTIIIESANRPVEVLRRAMITLEAKKSAFVSSSEKCEYARKLLSTPLGANIPPVNESKQEFVGQEAIERERECIRESFQAIESIDSVRIRIPDDVTESVFISETEPLLRLLGFAMRNEFLSNTAKLKFRYLTARRALQLLRAGYDEKGKIIETYTDSSIENYKCVSVPGLPNIRQLFLLAARLLELTDDDRLSLVIKYLAETFVAPSAWSSFRAVAFASSYELIKEFASSANIGLALENDKSKGFKFIKAIANGTIYLPNMLGLVNAMRKQSLEKLSPLIEALFMIMRGHNSKGRLEDPSEKNEPACAMGAYVNIMKAITESDIALRLAPSVLENLSNISMVDCAGIEHTM